MKQYIKIFTLTALAVSLFSVNASAMTIGEANYRDIDKYGETGILLNDANSSTSGVFDLTTLGDDGDGKDILGFDGSIHQVLDVVVGFIFIENAANTGHTITHSRFQLGEVFDALGGSDISEESSEYEINFSSAAFGSMKADLILDIEADGMLNWTVSLETDENTQAEGESLRLVRGYLGVIAEDRPLSSSKSFSVPDTGSTAALLGVAILGLVGVSSRRRS